MDVFLTRWVNGLAGQSAFVDSLVILVSTLGVPLMVLSVAGQWWMRFERARVRHVIAAAGLSFLIGLGANQLILLFFARVRPYEAGITQLLIERTTDPSFPSDHATASFAVAAAFLFHGLTDRGLFYLATACIIAFSRVYLGTHYVSDVLGGAAIGTISAAAVLIAYRQGTRIDRLVTSIL